MSSELVDVEKIWKRDRSKRDEGNAPAGAVLSNAAPTAIGTAPDNLYQLMLPPQPIRSEKRIVSERGWFSAAEM